MRMEPQKDSRMLRHLPEGALRWIPAPEAAQVGVGPEVADGGQLVLGPAEVREVHRKLLLCVILTVQRHGHGAVGEPPRPEPQVALLNRPALGSDVLVDRNHLCVQQDLAL